MIKFWNYFIKNLYLYTGLAGVIMIIYAQWDAGDPGKWPVSGIGVAMVLLSVIGGIVSYRNYIKRNAGR